MNCQKKPVKAHTRMLGISGKLLGVPCLTANANRKPEPSIPTDSMTHSNHIDIKRLLAAIACVSSVAEPMIYNFALEFP